MMLSARFLSTPALWQPTLLFGSVVPVLVPVPLDGPFDYLLENGQAPPAGTYRGRPLRRPRADRGGLGRGTSAAGGEQPAQAAGRRSRRATDARDAARIGHPHGSGDVGAAWLGPEAGAQCPRSARAVADQARLSPGRGRLARAGEPPACRCARSLAGRHCRAGTCPGEGGRRRRRSGPGNGPRWIAGAQSR